MCQQYVMAISITPPLLFLCFAALDKIHFNPRSALCPIGGPYQNRGHVHILINGFCEDFSPYSTQQESVRCVPSEILMSKRLFLCPSQYFIESGQDVSYAEILYSMGL